MPRTVAERISLNAKSLKRVKNGTIAITDYFNRPCCYAPKSELPMDYVTCPTT